MSTLEVNAIRPRTGTDIDMSAATNIVGFPNITVGSGRTIALGGSIGISGTYSQFKITGGTAGQAIITDGAGNISFGDVDALPSQTNNAGKYLTTDGTNASWGVVSGAEISELNNFFKNWNVIDSTIITTVASSENAAIIGPLGINTTGTWNIDGKVTIM